MGKRALLYEQSQVTLRHRRFEFANGTRFYALDKARELHSGYQMNPEAFDTVRDDALARSYARATELSFYRDRTKLSRRAVGSILREAAETLKKTGSQAARGLFELGLAADVEAGAKAPCMMADDAWLVPQRDPMGRISTEASGSVCTTLLSRSQAFWRSGVARVGSLCDLSALGIAPQHRRGRLARGREHQLPESTDSTRCSRCSQDNPDSKSKITEIASRIANNASFINMPKQPSAP